MILWNQRSDNTTCTVQIKGQKKKTKFQEMIYKTLHRKLKIEQHEPNKKNRNMNPTKNRGELGTIVVVLIDDMNMTIWYGNHVGHQCTLTKLHVIT